MTKLRVLITGAGVAGSALAFWLAKLGHSVTVIERHPELRVNGLQLDLRGYGIEVMKRMGLEQAVRAKVVPEDGLELVDSTGRRRAWFPANRSGKGAQSFSSEYEIMRSDLCQILYDSAVAEGAEYVFDKYVESFNEDAGTVSVIFNDGSVGDFNLVCGTDGLASKLRKLMFDAKSEKRSTLTDLPNRTAYFTIPQSIKKGESYIGTAYLMPGNRTVLTRRHSPNTIQVYMMSEIKYDVIRDMRRGDIASEKNAFAEVFRDGGWRCNELIKALQVGAEDWYCQYSGFVKLEKWSKGHVTLVGDAAHGVPPDGMGTSAALIGAYILAGEIARSCENEKGQDHVHDALQAYEQRFMPYIDHSQKGYSAEPSMFDKFPWTPLTLELFLYLAWFVSCIRLNVLLGRLMADGRVKGFSLPEYGFVRS